MIRSGGGAEGYVSGTNILRHTGTVATPRGPQAEHRNLSPASGTKVSRAKRSNATSAWCSHAQVAVSGVAPFAVTFAMSAGVIKWPSVS